MIPRLLAITPPTGPVSPACIAIAAEHGVPIAVLLREPGADPTEVVQCSRTADLRAAALAAGVPMLLSCPGDLVEQVAPIAHAAGLSGLQLRGDPGDAALIRAREAWPDAWIGASVHGPARSCAADYVVFAPVFPPRTPSAVAKRPVGIGPLTRWCRTHPRVFALGGVDATTANACIDAGAYGLASISSLAGERVREDLPALARALARRA